MDPSKHVDETSPLWSTPITASNGHGIDATILPLHPQTPARSALKYYSEYLTAVLHESDGRITSEQYDSLAGYRSKHGVAYSDHLDVLQSAGWTEEKFQSARFELPAEYVTFLQAILVDGVIEENEARRLAELKQKHSLSDADHLRALARLALTERDYLVALAKGATSRTVQRFGRSEAKIIEGEVDKAEFCRGLCVSPHLHQWFDVDSSGQRVMVREPGSDTRTSSSLESFYDLVVVAVVDKLVHLFSADHNRWFEFIVLFFSVWRVWSMTTYYNTLWDGRDLSMKFVMLIQMFGLLWMGLTAADAFSGEGPLAYSIGFAIAFAPVLVLYVWAILGRRRGWQSAITQLLSAFFAPAILLISGIIEQNVGSAKSLYFWIWLAAAILPELTPILTIFFPLIRQFRVPMNIEHVTERYALFLLIVLGETITSLMADLPWQVSLLSWPVFLGVGSGLVVAFSVKWLYFDVDEEKKIHPFRRTAFHGITWSLSHAPLCLAIAGAAAGFYGIQDSIVLYVEMELFPPNTTFAPPPDLRRRWLVQSPSTLTPTPVSTDNISLQKSHEILFCVGLSIALLCILLQAAVSKLHKHQIVDSKIRLGVRGAVAIAIGLLPFGTYGMGGLSLVLIVAALTFALALFEMIALLPSASARHPDFENLHAAPVDALRDFVSKAYLDGAVIPSEDGPHRRASIINDSLYEYTNKPV